MFLYFIFLYFMYFNILHILIEREKGTHILLMEDRTPWRLYFWGLAIRKALEPLWEHLLLEIVDILFQGIETVIAIRPFTWDWNILLKYQELKMIMGKALGYAVGTTWSPNHHFLRVGSNNFWLSNNLLNRTAKCHEKYSACLDLTPILSDKHRVY